MSEFEQWFESEFPDADLSQRETLKGYNNLKYGWNAALSSLQGDSTCEYAKSIGATEYKCSVKCLHNEYLPKRLMYEEIVEIMEDLKLDSRKAILHDFAHSIMNKMSADNQAAKIAEQEAEILRLRSENETLYTTMMAAAVEIHEHWDAHCDSEGYGPSNLMHRLERGIASRYGYDAKTVVDMQAKIAELAIKRGLEPEKVKPVIPCGGCGETDKNKRCLGCLHDFYHEQTLIARPNMEDL